MSFSPSFLPLQLMDLKQLGKLLLLSEGLIKSTTSITQRRENSYRLISFLRRYLLEQFCWMNGNSYLKSGTQFAAM